MLPNNSKVTPHLTVPNQIPLPPETPPALSPHNFTMHSGSFFTPSSPSLPTPNGAPRLTVYASNVSLIHLLFPCQSQCPGSPDPLFPKLQQWLLQQSGCLCPSVTRYPAHRGLTKYDAEYWFFYAVAVAFSVPKSLWSSVYPFPHL